MAQIRTYTRPFLILGDVFLLYASLYVTLVIRSGQVPSLATVWVNMRAFTPIFIVWMMVFLIMGLYERHSAALKNRLPSTIFQAQVINMVAAAILFYSFPLFDVAPKTILFIYLFVSSALIIAWRIYGPKLIATKSEKAVLIGEGAEYDELAKELSGQAGYPVHIVRMISYEEDLPSVIKENGATIVIARLNDTMSLQMTRSIYTCVSDRSILFIDFSDMYEEVFSRLPINALDERWFLQRITLAPKHVYDFFKRIVDICIAGPLFMVSLFLYPIIIFLIKKEDKGPVFFIQERVGQAGKRIQTIKFRSMTAHTNANGIAHIPKVTKIGAFMRKTRIDELPQLMNVLFGDLSLIGPRPEIPTLVSVYENEIPYYGVRHVVKPGLSGWAQINQKEPPKFAVQVDSTAQKLSYDLFYVKNRSVMLDLLIALRTIKELALRKGV